MISFKKVISSLCLSTLIIGMLVGCSGNNGENSTDETEITVVSREESSGTRGAFDELMDIKQKVGETEKSLLFDEAIIVNSTDSVASKVEVDQYAIGYTSLGAVNDRIKALKVDGILPTKDNIVNGSYKISRPFVLATNDKTSENAKDFIDFVTSTSGQKIVEEKGFVAGIDSPKEYQPKDISGKIMLSGSTSVEKVMEVLKEEYIKLNKNAQIEIIYSGSGAGIKDINSGKVDIAMSSRALTDKELSILKETKFALDAIAIVVNKDNKVEDLTKEQITNIFTGNARIWEQANK